MTVVDIDQVIIQSEIGRSQKTIVSSALWDNSLVACKELTRDTPLWRWYFRREIDVLTKLGELKCPIRYPRLLGYSRERNIMILDYLPGDPLSRNRLASASLQRSTVDHVVAIAEQFSLWGQRHAKLNLKACPATIRTQLTERFLEDPAAGANWCHQGISLGHKKHFVNDDEFECLQPFSADLPTSIQHGDLLPRNVLLDDNNVFVIDWECCGTYPIGWDLALFFVNIEPRLRRSIVRAISLWPIDQQRSFWVCVFWAIVRERKFVGRHAYNGRCVLRLGQLDRDASLAIKSLTNLANEQ